MNRAAARLALVAVPLVLVAALLATPVRAASLPEVSSVIEGRDTATDRPVLVLVGKKLTKFKTFGLEDPLGIRAPEDLDLMLKSKGLMVVGLPGDLEPGAYLLHANTKSETVTLAVKIGNGSPLPGAVELDSLEEDLFQTLRDAETLQGEGPSHYTDASNLDAGVLDPARYSAYDDLLAEAKVGSGEDQVAQGDHDHDAAYPRKEDLSAAGTLNDPANPVDWTRLKGVPEDLGDGYTAGDGLSLDGAEFSVDFGGDGAVTTAARSDHGHDDYAVKTDLSTAGTLNDAGNPVDWSRLKNVPAGFADGVDDGGWTLSSGNVYRSSGRVGIGVSSPDATLHVTGDDGVLFTGSGSGGIPATGAGARMMWFPGDRAFRAGHATGTEWDASNIGEYSMALGYGPMASGLYSVALGELTVASGQDATAMGVKTTASGAQSTAMGAFTKASGASSTATGSGNTSSGAYSFTAGSENTASGTRSFAIGYKTKASGAESSFATGGYNTASGTFAVAMGESNVAQARSSLVLGRYAITTGSTSSWVTTDPVLVVGNGDANGRSNAFTLLKNGNLTIAGTLTENSDARLKTGIAPLAGALARVATLRGVTYRLKDTKRGPEGRQIGLLAQDVRAAFPELVHESTDGTLSVSYGKLSAVLVEAVKEQRAEVETLRKALAEARRDADARIARLERLLGGKGEK